MLAKKNRGSRKTVKKIFKEGRFLNASTLTFRYLFTTGVRAPQISFIAPKSIAKLAVKRNLLRRRGYRALKKYIDQFPADITGVFIFKKYQVNISILENEIENILHKIH